MDFSKFAVLVKEDRGENRVNYFLNQETMEQVQRDFQDAWHPTHIVGLLSPTQTLEFDNILKNEDQYKSDFNNYCKLYELYAEQNLRDMQIQDSLNEKNNTNKEIDEILRKLQISKSL